MKKLLLQQLVRIAFLACFYVMGHFPLAAEEIETRTSLEDSETPVSLEEVANKPLEAVKMDPSVFLVTKSCDPAFVFSETLQSPITDEFYGQSIDFNGRYLFIGSPPTAEAPFGGSVYIYYFNENNQWILAQTITNGPFEIFGNVVKSRGDFLFVQSNGTPVNFRGSVIVYRLSRIPIAGTTAKRWEFSQIIDQNTPGLEDISFESNLGGSIDVDIPNRKLLIGASRQAFISPLTGILVANAGAAFSFKLNRVTQLWQFEQGFINPDGLSSDNFFGTAVAIEDGESMISAVPNGANGAVYVFRFSNRTSLWSFKQKLVGDETAALAQAVGSGDFFGNSISLDGRWVLIGAPLESFNLTTGIENGAAYFFRRHNDEWFKTQKVIGDALEPFRGIAFFTAAIREGIAIISDASLHNSLLVLRLRGSTWRPLTVIPSPDPTPGHSFGAFANLSRLSFFNTGFHRFIAGANLIVGEPGQVFIFEEICD